ncbi:MAG: DUF4837 family protein [Flavobacteriales bacterium]|nr:DUF4837 family protein [Flavobacteriales bacterium]
MTRFLLYFSLVITAAFASCSNDPKSLHDMLPRAGGRLGEVVVVMPDDQWKGLAGQAIRDAFYDSYLLLPQHETHFDLNHRNQGDFRRFFKEHRNILMVSIEDHIDNQDASSVAIKDKYAKNQTIMEIRARNTDEFLKEFGLKSDVIIDYFHRAEMDRELLNVRAKPNPEASQLLKEKFGISMSLPSAYKEVETDSTFSFFKLNFDTRNPDLDKGFFVYTFPYISDSTFSLTYLLRERERITTEYVHGSIPGSYMTTEYFYEPILDTLEINGRFTTRIRGLWKMEKEFLGGPFVSYSFVDGTGTQIITVESYVFAPHEDKRDHMRAGEAILTTARSLGE